MAKKKNSLYADEGFMTNVIIQIPKILKGKLEVVAKREHRSVNSQIVHLVSEYIKNQEGQE